jgi:hypothetical protein
MDDEQARRFARMMDADGSTLEVELGRGEVQSGRSFSESALDNLNHDMATWVGTRIVRRWNATGEPPTLLRVRLTVEVG